MSIAAALRAGLARACAALWLLACSGMALAQPTGTLQPDSSGVAFELTIEAPDTVRALLERHLELQRFRTLPDLSRAELEQLLQALPANARELLGTQGYFAPRIQVQTDAPGAAAAATPTNRPRRIVLVVEPGPPARVASVDLQIQGAGATEPEAAAQRERFQSSWALPAGQPFSQSAWDSAKNQALRLWTERRYPTAQVAESRATIDPERQEARLRLVLDTGPAVRFGEITVTGDERYPADAVQRLVRLGGLRPGDDYDLGVLQAAQQRVSESGYYRSVFLRVDVDAATAQAQAGTDGSAPMTAPMTAPITAPMTVPVTAQVREARLQRLVLGVGASTDAGARLSLEHTHRQLPGLGWQAQTALQLQQRNSSASTEWASPLDDKGWRWIAGAGAQRDDDDPRVITSQRLRLGQLQETGLLDRSFFLQLDRAREFDGQVTLPTEGSVTANYAWTRRRFNDTLFPDRGYGLAVELGAGYTLSQEREPFGRVRARWQNYLPLAANSERPSRLALRLEGGAVLARDNTPVPATQRFLTGGDNAVRGYALRDIGVPQATGGVAPGRYLAVGSVEWQRPLWRNGERTDWESTLFIDAGAVADAVRDLKAQVGVGTGLRYNSPVGPLQVDLAYGLEQRRWRLHLNVGFAF